MTLKLNGSTNGSVSIDAPADTSPSGTDVTLTLPTSAGSSGQYLQTNGSGTLSWQTVAGLPDAIDVNASAPADSVNIDSSGNVGINETSPSTFNDAGTGGVNFVIGASGSGRGVLTFASEQTGGAEEPLGIVNFVDSDTTNTATRGARILGIRGSDANTAYLKFETPNSGAPAERMRISNNGDIYLGPSAGYRTDPWAESGSGQGIFYYKGDRGSTTISTNADTGFANIYVNRFAYGGGGDNDNRLVAWYINGTQQATITTNGTSVSYNTGSDYRLKQNVVALTGAIDRVKTFKPIRFNWIDPINPATVDGFLAHEAAEVVPEAVDGEKDGLNADGTPKYQQIDQSKLVPLLTAALQEAISKIEALETTNVSLEARLTALEGGAA